MAHDPPSRSRFPSLRAVEKWGVVEAWLAGGYGRMVVLASGPKGLQVTLVDPSNGEQIEYVDINEEPPAAIMRALARFL